MAKMPKLAVRDILTIPLREVSGLTLLDGRLLAVGDHDPVVFGATVDPWPATGPVWHGIDLGSVDLPDGGVQFEAISPVDGAVLVLQEQPARVLHLDLRRPALLGVSDLEVPEGHPLRESWLGDRSSRGESLLVLDGGHLLVVKEKDPTAILEFGPPGAAPVGWRRGAPVVAPTPGPLEVLATWEPGPRLRESLPDVSDATVGPDGRLYLLSDQGSAIARLPDSLDPHGGAVEAVDVWRIEGRPEKAEGLVLLADGTPLVALDTKSPKRNLLRLERLPLDSAGGRSA